MNQNQTAQSIRSNNIRKAPHVLGQALSKLSPNGHSNSPTNISRDVNPRVPGNGILNQGHHLQKLIDPSSRKAGGLATSNSPKGMVHTNKLFLKGFHHEHQKLFTVNDGETFSKGPQFSDYKRVP